MRVDKLQVFYGLRLSNEQLLQWCLGAHIQNNCEWSSLIRKRCHKQSSLGKDSQDFGVAGAVSQFNDDKFSHYIMLSSLEIFAGHHSCAGLYKRDPRRIRQSNIQSNYLAKKIRQSRAIYGVESYSRHLARC